MRTRTDAPDLSSGICFICNQVCNEGGPCEACQPCLGCIMHVRRLVELLEPERDINIPAGAWSDIFICEPCLRTGIEGGLISILPE